MYKILYKQLKVAGVGGGTKTFVYPQWLRELVRARFEIDVKYDQQFEGRPDVNNVTNDDLIGAEWPDMATDCAFCQSNSCVVSCGRILIALFCTFSKASKFGLNSGLILKFGLSL